MQQTTVTLGGDTFTLGNSMWLDVVQITLRDKYEGKDPDRLDAGYWSDFLLVAPYIVAVDGWAWEPLTEAASQKEVEARYQAMLRRFSRNEFDQLIDGVVALRAPKGGPLDKPDAALTEAEQADPN